MSLDPHKYEDTILKMAHTYFGTTLLPFFGIHEPIADTGPTEISLLTITKKYMDFTFLTTSGKYLHFEFQSTDGGITDLRRFHVYEALLNYSSGRDVITYIIFTGGIEDAIYEYTCGINTYTAYPIYMEAKDADCILENLKQKKANHEPLTEEDLAMLTLTPVMGSRFSKKQRIMEAVKLLKGEHSEKSAHAMAMLYAFAEKFITDSKDLEELKGVMLMTRLGQMIFDDGLEQGHEKGLAEGRNQIQALNLRLLDDNRLEDLKRAASDSVFCQQLLEEYGLLTPTK